MQKKVILRTIKKVAVFFGAIFAGVAVVELSSLVGGYLFDNPIWGTIFVVGAGVLSAIFYFAYKEAKYEVDRENEKLIQELTKHG